MSKPAIFQFILARIIEDENEADADERHWSEVGASAFSNQRLRDECDAKRTMLHNLAVMVNFDWSGSYAVRDASRELVVAMADVYVEHPDYPKGDPWAPRTETETPTNTKGGSL